MSLARTTARRTLQSRILFSSSTTILTTTTTTLTHRHSIHPTHTTPHPLTRHYATSSSSYAPVGPYPSTSKRAINYGICIVPQQSAWVIERFGKFNRILSPGLHFLIPLVDRIAYIHSLKEQAIPIGNQQAITMDNVTINIDGVLYLRINNPEQASYGVNDIYYAMTQLAQTTMRSELGKITLDQTFANRESLNANIVAAINSAAQPWGVQCLRYEIRDITPPSSVKYAMDMQAEAERKKRATILDSEGSQQSEINVANGARQATILNAQGEAAAILAKAEATARGIDLLAEAIARRGGKEAVGLRIAEQYVEAFGQIAQKGNTMLLPSGVSDPSSMIAQALAIYGQVVQKQSAAGNSGGGSNGLEAEESSGGEDQEGGSRSSQYSGDSARRLDGLGTSTVAANATSAGSSSSYFTSPYLSSQQTSHADYASRPLPKQ